MRGRKSRKGVLSFAAVAASHGERVCDGTGRARHVCLSIRSLSLGVPASSLFLLLNSDELRNDAVLKQQFQCKKPI